MARLKKCSLLLFIVLSFGKPILAGIPQAACDAPLFEFERRAVGNIVSNTFVLRNEGTAELMIFDVRVCCGVKAQLSQQSIMPKESAALHVHLDLTGKTAELEKSIYVRTNDPAKRYLRLVLKECDTVPVEVQTNDSMPIGNAADATANRDDAQGFALPEAMEPGSKEVEEDVLTVVPPEDAVLIEYFFERGCDECLAVRKRVLEPLLHAHKGRIEIQERDLAQENHFLLLLTYQERLVFDLHAPAVVVIDRQYALAGLREIEAQLAHYVLDSLARRAANGQSTGYALPAEPELKCKTEIKEMVDAFTPSLVALAGLSDGFNPCAFGTIIFLASLLAAGGRSRRDVFWGGLAFCGASFVTYFSIGFGLLALVRSVEWRGEARSIVELIMAALLAFLGMLSLRDARRYKQTGKAESVTLRLPESIKQRIVNLGRSRWRSSGVVVAGLVCGAGVTVLESVCTGQLYLPTLVHVSRFGNRRAWALLLLYNVAFIIPLFAVFLGVACGMRNRRLAQLARDNVVPAKIMLGILFMLLAAAMVWRTIS